MIARAAGVRIGYLKGLPYRSEIMLQCTNMQEAIAIKAVAAGRRTAYSLLMGAAILLGGCESIPDAVNPFVWFEDDDPAPPPPTAAAKPGTPVADQAYPTLGSVPKRPSLASQQATIAQGLAADNENARYTDEKIQREVARRAGAPFGAAARAAVPAPRRVPPAPRVAPAQLQPVAPRSVPPPPSRQRVLPPPPVAPPVAVPQPRTLSQLRAVPRSSPAPAARPVAPPVQSAARPVPPAPSPVARPSAPAPAPAPAFASGQSVQVATIYFQDGSTKLQVNDQAVLREIAAAQRQSGSAVRVVGHASGRVNAFDPSRRHMINYQISLDRAHAVAAALLSLGVPVGKLQVEGKGDTAPKYAEYSTTGEAANRRTELYFLN